MTSFRGILGQSWTLKFHKVKLLKFKTFNFDLKYFRKWQFFHYDFFFRFKNGLQLPGAGRTRVGHHHRSDTPTSPRAVYVLKSAKCNEIMPSVYYHSSLYFPCKQKYRVYYMKNTICLCFGSKIEGGLNKVHWLAFCASNQT